MSSPASMPLSKWPARDRSLWLEAIGASPTLDASSISMWQASTQKTAAGAYGIWLQWLADRGALDNADPETRLSPSLVKAFARDQIDRKLRMTTVADRLGRLVSVVSALRPDSDLSEIRAIARRVERVAKRQTRPSGFIVHACKMYGLGFELMGAGRSAGVQCADGAALFIDGLVIAMMTACPIRIGDFCQLRLDHELVRENDRWRLLGKSRKTSKPEIRRIPDDLGPFVDEYIAAVRSRLMALRQLPVCNQDAFFMSESGYPLHEQVMRRRIEARTEKAFGTPVRPHSFRKLAITTLVMERPEHAASASMLLNHSDPKIDEDHYIIGQQILSQESYHKTLERAERQAKDEAGLARSADEQA